MVDQIVALLLVFVVSVVSQFMNKPSKERYESCAWSIEIYQVDP